jgi:hypothetical protein
LGLVVFVWGGVLLCVELRGRGTGGFVGSVKGMGFEVEVVVDVVVVVVVVVDVTFGAGFVGAGTGGSVGLVVFIVGGLLELLLIPASGLAISPAKTVVRFFC